MRISYRQGWLCCALLLVACGGVESDGPTPADHDSERGESTRQAAQTDGVTPLIDWTRTFGEQELARSFAVDAFDGVYVAGSVGFALPGQEDGFRTDAFVRKYDEKGDEVWTRQFDFGSIEDAAGIAVDRTGVYVVGQALDIIPGRGVEAGAFLRKYTHQGDLVWTSGVSTPGLRVTNPADIVLDDTGIYVAGWAATFAGVTFPAEPMDAFVAKLDKAEGELLWRERFGDPDVDDAATGVDAGAAGVYVSGWTDGDLPGEASEGGRDALVRRVARNGEEIWTRQFGTSADDEAADVATHADSVYAAGQTEGAFFGRESAGAQDAFVRSFGADAAELQTDQFGTPELDVIDAIDATAEGVYVAGWTRGALPGETRTARIDAFARRYDGDLEEVWTQQFAIARNNFARGLAARDDQVFVTGTAETAQGGTASFLTRIVEDGVEPPPPGEDCEVIDGDVVVNDPGDIGRLVANDDCFEITGGLFIQRTSDIYDLEFLSGLRSVGGYVGIADNVDLESLAGLEQLESIGEGLVIEGNPNLVSVTEFASLAQIDGVLHIFGNPRLPTCEADALVEMVGRANIGGQIIIAATDDEVGCL